VIRFPCAFHPLRDVASMAECLLLSYRPLPRHTLADMAALREANPRYPATVHLTAIDKLRTAGERARRIQVHTSHS
jgi:hypothetical protein